MFANRFVALIDACSLVSVLGRNTLLSLAEAELYRVKWSDKILDEAQAALSQLFAKRELDEYEDRARHQREAMETAFPEAAVEGYEPHIPLKDELPDPNDGHVVAAAVMCDASIIVTENLKDFPDDFLATLSIEAKSSDSFIADTIDLDPARAINALATMRARFDRPELTAETLLLKYESEGFIQTADILRPYAANL